MAVYYNEIDRGKAAWIRELIKAKIIASGEVDERDIKQVKPADLRGFAQCHFFAGIAIWSYALRLAGWPDDRPCWTGSCPCPSFSCAGKGTGFDDPRHLWPNWYSLIRECRPRTIFSEQSKDAIRFGWLDLVQGNLEAETYAFAAVVLGAHSAGAPHIRQRLYFVAQGDVGGLGNSGGTRLSERERNSRVQREALDPYAREAIISAGCPPAGRATGRLANYADDRRERTGSAWRRGIGSADDRADDVSSSVNGFWRDVDWLLCRDDKWRPVEPGTFPLAHGATNRVLKLRGFGDGLCAPTAEAFIRAFMDTDD